MDLTQVRLGNELCLGSDAASQLRAATRVYHSFVPLSCTEPSDERAHQPEWTHAWCRPRPGALLQALIDYGVEPHDALFVCANERDEEAAEAASMASIRIEQLLGMSPFDFVRLPGKGPRHGPKAPAAFAFNA
jgi:hypothetical protein